MCQPEQDGDRTRRVYRIAMKDGTCLYGVLHYSNRQRSNRPWRWFFNLDALPRPAACASVHAGTRWTASPGCADSRLDRQRNRGARHPCSNRYEPPATTPTAPSRRPQSKSANSASYRYQVAAPARVMAEAAGNRRHSPSPSWPMVTEPRPHPKGDTVANGRYSDTPPDDPFLAVSVVDQQIVEAPTVIEGNLEAHAGTIAVPRGSTICANSIPAIITTAAR